MAKKSATPKKKPVKRTKRPGGKSPGQPGSIRAGGTVIKGSLSMKGGKFAGRDLTEISTSSEQHIQTLFQPIYQTIAARPDTSREDRGDLKSEVQEIETELKKGDKADESFLVRRLRNLKRMAPDILAVLLATLANPAAGLGLVADKITKRMADHTLPRETPKPSL